jgi:predicted enzyme related to lactoylglutathione lyase
MGERTTHAPGTFSWVDLSTTDQPAAKAFYGALLGWEALDLPIDENTVYSMQLVRGHAVAAISPQPQAQTEAGVPPLWNSYVTVESADEAAARAAELGGTVHAGPFDVMEAGRMAVIQDPQGAFFMVWQPGQNIGAGLVNEPGALCWNDLSTPDMDGAQAFYGALFGWTFTPMEGGDQPYVVISNKERANGGIRPLDPPGMPPNWAVYFAVEDLDASLARAEELGGAKLMGPIDIGIARFGVVADPQGAVFLLYAGQLDS